MDTEFLRRLVSAYSPSGNEGSASDVFAYYLKDRCNINHEFTDNIGNLCFSVGKPTAEFSFMLSGHIDEIGLRVQRIDDNGFIHFIKNGGIDPKVLLGSSVAILSKHGVIHGVIGKKPIHVEWKTEEKDKVTDIKDMKIDCGFESAEEAKSVVSIGDTIIIKDIPNYELGKHRFCARGLDDKVGVFVTAEVLKRLSELPNPLQHIKVYGVACTQEETSGSGAISASKRINPQYSIDYDVTFATDDDFVSPNDWGDIKLGKGGAIAHSVDTNNELVNRIKNCCINNNIPFQEFALCSGGTNTIHIKHSADDCQTALLSIPNRNMHTQVEVCDYRDLESLIDMTVATIITMDNEFAEAFALANLRKKLNEC